MLTGITLCSGGGGSALGIQAAGVQLVGAVEHDAAIAAQYAANLGDHVTVAQVQDVDYRQWAGVDVVQASPPCPNFSSAKQGGVEGPDDLAIAAACCRAIRAIRPRVFWLENVEGYAASQSYAMIRATLDDLDYWSHAAVVNAADFGVAQTRRRLILRAVAGGLWQPFRPLPNAVPWVGWYAAIADLIPTLPASEFAPWQLKRLLDTPVAQLIGGGNTSDASLENGWHSTARTVEQPAFTVATNAQMPRAFIVDRVLSDRGRVVTVRHSDNPMCTVTTNADSLTSIRAFLLDTSTTDGGSGIGVRNADAPAQTVRAGSNHQYRAFLVDGMNARTAEKGGLSVLAASEPAMTVPGSDKGSYCAWLDCGRVVKMTPRALARFQAFPDNYVLPSNNALACRILGNAVPPLLARRIMESLL